MAGLFRVYARRPFLFTTPTPVSSSICHISDHWHSRLLRARRERPRRRRAAEQRYELAALHSITSSASESRLSEILIPSALAVLRLITVSNLVGCSTGRSAGFAPLRILAV